MKYIITLKDRITGYQREYVQPYDYQDRPERSSTADEQVKYQWLEGNYECDCNRALFLWDHEGEELSCNKYQDDTTRRIDLLKIIDATGHQVWPTIS